MIVHEDDSEVVISTVEPASLLSVVDNAATDAIAAEVRTHFSGALTRVAEDGST